MGIQSNQFNTYLHFAGKIAAQAQANSALITPSLREMLKYIVRCIGATSAYVCSYQPDEQCATVISEYIAGKAHIAEEVSDMDEVYDLDSMGGDMLAWLDANQRTPRIIHVDELPDDDPERAELLEYGGKTVLFVGGHLDDRMWGFIEIWDSTQKRHYTPDELAFVGEIAAHIGSFVGKR